MIYYDDFADEKTEAESCWTAQGPQLVCESTNFECSREAVGHAVTSVLSHCIDEVESHFPLEPGICIFFIHWRKNDHPDKEKGTS